MDTNIIAAWIAFFVGGVAGAIPGLLFHDPDWLGGYDSWQRRLTRLGHISFFGLGLVNLCFGLSVSHFGIESGLALISILLVIGLITMPAVCYLAAFRKPFRHLFFIPAGSIIVAMGLFIWRLAQL